MFKFFHTHSKPIMNSTQEALQRWEVRRLRNSSIFVKNIPAPDVLLNLDASPLHLTPLHIASFRCFDFRKPIEELVIARYPKNLISALAIARTGVSQQFLNLLQEKSPGSIWCTNFRDDKRKRAALTTTCEDKQQLLRMYDFINIVDVLGSLNPLAKNYISEVFDPDNEGVKTTLDLPIFKTEIDPPYFRFSPSSAYFSTRCFFNPHSDKIISQTIPKLHNAILDNNVTEVEKIIANDPWSVLQRDPLGFTACQIAHHWGSTKVFRVLVNARAKVVSVEDMLQHNYHLILENPELTDDVEYSLQEQKQNRETYLAFFDQEHPKRADLHHACILGNIQQVKTILDQKPKRIEEQDLLGFTPLLLAAANGHAELVEWLIEKGASIKTVSYTNLLKTRMSYRLIDHAANAAVMEKILHHYVDPDVVNDKLASAVKNNDFAMMKVITFYINRLHTDSVGLTPLDLLIKNSTEKDTEMLKFFLKYWENYVPNGPYDDDIPEAVRQILIDHNKKRVRKEEINTKRPVIISPMKLEETDVILQTKLKLTPDVQIISTIKNMASVSEDEYQQCEVLFKNCFKMRVDDSPYNQKKYFNNLFRASTHDKSYIDICKIDGKVISFLAFECRESQHSIIGKFLLYHGQLGATHPMYEGMNLANLAFRVPLAMKKIAANVPVIIFVKAIQPGFGACLLPRPVKFFPKYQYPQDLMQHIVNLTGEKLEGNKITAKLKVISRPITDLNLQLEQYRYLIGENDRDAMAIAFEVDEEVIEHYLLQLKFHGVTEENLFAFSSLWKEFTSLPLKPNSSIGAKL